MTSNTVLPALRRHIATLGLDGVVIPRFDAHQGENVAPHDERLRYVTGFSGSAGIALVLADRAVIFVDGRYQVQVRKEIDLEQITVSHFYDFPIERWIETQLGSGMRIGLNTMLAPASLHDKLDKAMSAAGGELVALDADPVDAVWTDQPPPPLGRISPFPLTFAGETSHAKREQIAQKLAGLGADLMVEAQPDNIAWLLNVRGSDIANMPMPHSFLLLDRDGGVEWFVDGRKLPNSRDDFELDGVAVRSPETLLEALARRAEGRSVLVDPQFAPAAAGLAVNAANGRVVAAMSPITVAKAVKNGVELQGFRDAHVTDGIAWTEFMTWLHDTVPGREVAGDPLTELEAEARILEFRQRGDNFAEASFRTISASAANAAMCHYASSEATNAPITSRGPYLIDSGGQYFTGTTDATRTTAFAPVGEDIRNAYTAVLKGFIALMTAQFPEGTTGHQLDALARRPLWDLGLDFDHGTGHGVGHYLAVHEHPQRFAKVHNPHALATGVIMTVEPGYYRENEFGLRIENQVETVAGPPGFLRFETLTLAPIDLGLADCSSLTAKEKAFLNDYHRRVREALSGRLSASAEARLQAWTAPIAP
ncbi:M24 family metallopeptidase [Mesorhizobium sp. IMUNJ 23232]|uniref:M24 family metallopeptidase n=1 Tax=Mesorhizobium sp. IMUNJ 23232 TaxID=3376064 RepID=UPI003798C42A